MFIVTIDSGTTNTRVRIWQDKRIIADACAAVGVRDSAKSGNLATLTAGIKDALDRALAQAENCTLDRCAIVASGMITADVGLCPLPHLSAPVGVEQLANGAVARHIPAIAPQPIWFIPGVKNALPQVNLANLDMMDVMRGEEAETFGLLALHAVHGPAVIVLPGSHSKFVKIDRQQRIAACATTMAGELLDVLTHHTLLAGSLDRQFAARLELDYLLQGAEACRRTGLSRACFSVRLLDLFTDATHDQKASYLLGVTLCADIQAMKQSRALAMTPDTRVVISGKPILQQALAALIATDPFFTADALLVDEDPARPLSSIGAIAVMEIIMRQATPHSAAPSDVVASGDPL
ncbi:2-dehydro-3-deoxygalactonokinase [Serratia sp. JUb9]|uniref:2-dehydro-3-deoxygalactonokinase n=1 Tax=Serratia sp. JUb9 TaxID=2724469 RepID=UPI00164ECA0D|nr:2-dehydro-3-deoxygalactonokinase [Serratia sp. JUb9]QNK34083.1 2-dehydro-3-deoxygalactonokinase [Serratia sp. JUb9]